MKRFLTAAAVFSVTVWLPIASGQQQSGTASSSTQASSQQKNIERYLRNLYAFGPDVLMTVGPFKETGVPGLRETTVDVTVDGNKQSVKFFTSSDGKYLLQGELSDLTKDPLVENSQRIQMHDAPSTGGSNAPVTLVEYSDFECPVCRSLHDVLRGLLANYNGQIRVVFKDFPIEQLHPWARTAAIAGRCAYQQDPNSFWKMYDFIYDNQDVISAANAFTKMIDYAGQSGLDPDAFKSCMASPEAATAVEASRTNGQQLDVNSTPTIFVNGRRIVGADPHLLEQYIQYELAKNKTTDKTVR